MKKIQIDTRHGGKVINNEALKGIEAEIRASRKTLLDGSGRGNDFLGWVGLPSEQGVEIVEAIKGEVERLRPKIKYFVVIGIGGSYLGARAVIEAMRSEVTVYSKGEGVEVLYAGHTLNEDYYSELLRVLDGGDYAIAVISKSGTTTEPAVAFRILKAHIENKYGKEEASKRIIAITDARRGALHDIAEQEGYHSYVIPDNVGGRFSVLTPVGLLPIAMAGYDIEQLLAGAREMEKHCKENDNIEENIAMQYAGIRNLLYRSGRKVEMLTNFTPALRYISEWWKQLYGESEGKEGKGLLPHSLSYTTDLHSMGQYVQEGERLMFETVISVARANHSVSLPEDEKNLDGINYLIGKSLTDINHCAEMGTVIAHEKGGVPVVRIEIPGIDENVIGQLIYFFEFACGISGYTLGVNPFDQPGVEAYKKNMFHLLGKPGYENV